MDPIAKKYQIVRSLGKGGMGEVLLARELSCNRLVALKKMRPEWADNTTMSKRFLREARLASQLSHPSIIAIYTLDEEGGYYTMPYVEGETLKAVLRSTKEKLKEGGPPHPIGSSIPTLARLFLSICSAIAYAHARGVIHRDLKPENVIVGKYGEVIILDWGLARSFDEPCEEKEEFPLLSKITGEQITEPGKIPGTLLYMAPERALGKGSSVLTDIYSLGVMLYQMLTLEFPFKRSSLKEFRKRHTKEQILDPQEVAPMRESSVQLRNIVKKCLAKEPLDRYSSVTALIQDLERYINGVPQWVIAGRLHHMKKEDWLFQENIPLSNHRALTSGIEGLEWGNLMVSKGSFPGNLKIDTEIVLKKKSKGMGCLLCIPEIATIEAIYGALGALTVWISLEGISILRSNSEVCKTEKMTLNPGHCYKLSIAYLHPHLHVFLDGVCCLTHLSYLSLPGTRIGLLLKDGLAKCKPLQVSLAGQHILVSCLAIPEAFVSKGYEEEALSEYLKIAESFPGREEGQEALFRAGWTLVEKGKKEEPRKRKKLFAAAFLAFEKLHKSPAAPLEYLGKALIYRAEKEVEEEEKCLELALRKFPTHPLRPQIIESIFSRLYETSQYDRESAYRFALIALRHLPDLFQTRTIAEVLKESLQKAPFFSSTDSSLGLAIQLGFWLDKPAMLHEMIEKAEGEEKRNGESALYLLGERPSLEHPFSIEALQYAHFFRSLDRKEKESFPISSATLKIWDALMKKNWGRAQELFLPVSLEDKREGNSFLCFLWGCLLAHIKGEKAATTHFKESMTETAYPPLAALFSHYLVDRRNFKKRWLSRAFSWEKKIFLFEYKLFYSCVKGKKMPSLSRDIAHALKK